jgi:hypothetical protein
VGKNAPLILLRFFPLFCYRHSFIYFFLSQFNSALNSVNQPITQSECLNGATHGSAHILIGGIWHKSIADDSLVNTAVFVRISSFLVSFILLGITSLIHILASHSYSRLSFLAFTTLLLSCTYLPTLFLLNACLLFYSCRWTLRRHTSCC